MSGVRALPARLRPLGRKGLLLVVALVAAYTASLKPDNILFMVGLAFSIGASISWRMTGWSGPNIAPEAMRKSRE